MKKEQEQQIVIYCSATDKYIRSQLHSNAHQSVFTKESDKYQWLVLEQKSQSEVEVRQTNRHGTITVRDKGELTRNIPKCVSLESLCEGANFQIPFIADEINLIYQFGEQTKAEKCTALTAATKRRKITEHDNSIRERLTSAKEQSKQPTVVVGKKHRTHSKGKGVYADRKTGRPFEKKQRIYA